MEQSQHNLVANQVMQNNRLPKFKTKNQEAIVDSGTTGHYLLTTSTTTRRFPTSAPIKVKLPDGSQIQSSHQCEIDLPLLPPAA